MATTYTIIPYLISLINYQHYYRFGASLPLFFYCLFYHYKKEVAFICHYIGQSDCALRTQKKQPPPTGSSEFSGGGGTPCRAGQEAPG
jgi:hypothetical protein